MGKSECEQELETVRAECDHWKRIAQERERVIQDLKNRLERSEMYADAFTSGAMSKLDERISQIQDERDLFKKELEHLEASVQDQKNRMKVGTDELKAFVTEKLQEIDKTVQELSDAIIGKEALYGVVQENTFLPFSTIKLINRDLSLLKDEAKDAELWELLLFTRIAGMIIPLELSLGEITIRSLQPSSIAKGLLEYCYAKEKASNDLITMFPSDMFEEKGLFSDTTPQTLAIALTTCVKWKNSGLTKEAFCQKEGLTTRRLRDYERFFERMESLAKRVIL